MYIVSTKMNIFRSKFKKKKWFSLRSYKYCSQYVKKKMFKIIVLNIFQSFSVGFPISYIQGERIQRKLKSVKLKSSLLGNIITSNLQMCYNTFLEPFGLTTTRTSRTVLLLVKVFAEKNKPKHYFVTNKYIFDKFNFGKGIFSLFAIINVPIL